jgi:hypothetical protein
LGAAFHHEDTDRTKVEKGKIRVLRRVLELFNTIPKRLLAMRHIFRVVQKIRFLRRRTEENERGRRRAIESRKDFLNSFKMTAGRSRDFDLYFFKANNPFCSILLTVRSSIMSSTLRPRIFSLLAPKSRMILRIPSGVGKILRS